MPTYSEMRRIESVRRMFDRERSEVNSERQRAATRMLDDSRQRMAKRLAANPLRAVYRGAVRGHLRRFTLEIVPMTDEHWNRLLFQPSKGDSWHGVIVQGKLVLGTAYCSSRQIRGLA